MCRSCTVWPYVRSSPCRLRKMPVCKFAQSIATHFSARAKPALDKATDATWTETDRSNSAWFCFSSTSTAFRSCCSFLLLDSLLSSRVCEAAVKNCQRTGVVERAQSWQATRGEEAKMTARTSAEDGGQPGAESDRALLHVGFS